MENELILKAFVYGIGYGLSMFWWIGLLISIFELIYETALEKKWRRNNLKFLSNEDIELINYKLNTYYAENDIGKIIVNAYKNQNDLKTFRKENKKKFFNKLKFWKKKKNIKRIPPGYITFSEQFTKSEFFKGENVEKEFNAFIKSLGLTKKDIKKMK